MSAMPPPLHEVSYGLDSAVADHELSRTPGFEGVAHNIEDGVPGTTDFTGLEENHNSNTGSDLALNGDTVLEESGLSHPRPTSHGTYVEGGNHGLENLEYYEKGGYHPVHLGDHLGPNNRYRVIHKLGYGGFDTVWLCRDNSGGRYRYVAVKVMTDDASPDKLLDLSFSNMDRSQPGAEYIAFPLDHFRITGPNGDHHCVVLAVLGPCASPDMWRMYDDPGPVLRKMCQQAVEGLGFLHDNGICHGDFRPANILVQLSSLDHLSEAEIFELLGKPDKSEVGMASSEDLPNSAPRYLVNPADFSEIRKYLTDKIMIIDFTEAFRMSSPPPDLGIPENYLPPEAIFKDESAIGVGCDMWALACTLYEIRAQIPLFYMTVDDDDLLSEMVCNFGKLPAPWWSKWQSRDKFFDKNGGRLGSMHMTTDGESWSLETCLNNKLEIGGHFGSEKVFGIPADEQGLLADLIRSLCDYDPRKRPSVREVLQHEWFNA